jgi:hypothetical protein
VLVDLKGFWRWCMLYRTHRIFLDFSIVRYSKKHPVSETSSFFEYRTMEKVQKNSEFCTNSVCYTPSSEPFRIYSHSVCDSAVLR